MTDRTEFRYCRTCTMPSSRPGLTLDADGICPACRWHEKKKHINWQERHQQFQAIADWAKTTTKGAFDCVLGVSGGKDSLWQAHQLRDVFGLNPLLVQYVSSDANELGRKNAENMVNCGFTLISIQPNPKVARTLAKKSFLEFGNIAKFSELALFSAPFRTAMEYDIPLVFFGENPALEAGDINTDTAGWDASGIRFSNTLSGGGRDMWLTEGVTKEDLILYTFPNETEFDTWGGRGVFMGYFLDWSGWKNAIFSMSHGMSPHGDIPDNIGLHYRHHSLDSNHGAMVNFMLKHIKFGFGETTEHTAYDVRAGRLSREEAAALIKRLDGKCHPKYIQDFCRWIGITEAEFHDTAEKFRGKMWRKDNEGNWYIDRPIWFDYPNADRIDTGELIHRVDTVRRVEVKS
jgi:N-acetyl sugar amidotransferase